MKNLNLKGATIEDIENFFLEVLSKDVKIITCETGEIGLLSFHRLIEEWISKIGGKKDCKISTGNIGIKDVQYVEYVFANNKKLLLLHAPELDLIEGQEIDNETGFPIKANTLYLKK